MAGERRLHAADDGSIWVRGNGGSRPPSPSHPDGQLGAPEPPTRGRLRSGRLRDPVTVLGLDERTIADRGARANGVINRRHQLEREPRILDILVIAVGVEGDT